MIRSVKIVSPLNKKKLQQLHDFLIEYHNCVSYFITRLWAEHKLNGTYLDSEYINAAKSRFNLTARLIQSAGKQSLEIVKSQRKLSKTQQAMPRLKNLTANLDSRFWEIAENSNSFNWLKIQSGFTSFLPFKKTRMWNKWTNKGFTLSKSIRLLKKKDRIFIEFFFEKEAPEKKTEGDVEGLDLGYVNIAVCSNGQKIGEHINEFIRGFARREKHTHKQITQRCYQELKKLDLAPVKALVLEDLKYVKHNTRGMFSRTHNRRLSHWIYSKVMDWLDMRCEEQGIQIIKVSPYKTSQFCRICGKWDRRNRKGEEFCCVHCGHREHADSNASQNLKLLGLAGVYSLRSLQTSLVDIYP
jgi:putative transposase